MSPQFSEFPVPAPPVDSDRREPESGVLVPLTVAGGGLEKSFNVAELAAYIPAAPANAGEFLPYIRMHWPIEGPGKSYFLQLTDGGVATAQWLESPFVLSIIFNREAAKIPNLPQPEMTEWAFASMPGCPSRSDARYKVLVSGSIANVEKGTSYLFAMWKAGQDVPTLVTFDAFKTMNNATFNRFNEGRMNLRKGLMFSTGDLSSCMKESSKTHRWFPDAGRFSSLTRLTDLTEHDSIAVETTLAADESRVRNWLTR